jgi:hypothetical protein
MRSLRNGMRVALTFVAAAVVSCSSSEPRTFGGGPAPAPSPTDSAAPAGDTSPAPVEEIDGYPKGPHGWAVGQVFPRLTFDAKLGGKGAFTRVSTKDYYDRDGARGIRALYLTVSAPWCPACVSEAKTFPEEFATTYAPRGARFLTLLAEDAGHKPASRATVDAWITEFRTNYDIGLDPGYAALPKDDTGRGSVAIPYNYVIDPRTMRVVHINAGPFFTSGPIRGLTELLEKNGG